MSCVGHITLKSRIGRLSLTTRLRFAGLKPSASAPAILRLISYASARERLIVHITGHEITCVILTLTVLPQSLHRVAVQPE